MLSLLIEYWKDLECCSMKGKLGRYAIEYKGVWYTSEKDCCEKLGKVYANIKNYNTRYNLGRLYYLHLICYVYLHPQAFYITVLS